MKPENAYLKFVRWSDEDRGYVGYCPDLFPWGGVCHAEREEEACHQLCALVSEEIADLRAAGRELPPPHSHPMHEAIVV